MTRKAALPTLAEKLRGVAGAIERRGQWLASRHARLLREAAADIELRTHAINDLQARLARKEPTA